jgi:diguanylate cyclase (GGDEF)-like protein/PAS domain S-box-containing protein
LGEASRTESRRGMSGFLRTKRTAWGAALFFAVFVLTLSYVTGRRYKNALDWVEHTHLVRSSLERVLSSTIDHESAVRGYVITGDVRFLARGRRAETAAQDELRHTRELVRDNPTQAARAAELGRSVADKLTFAARLVEARDQDAIVRANAMVGSLQNKLLMDRVRGTVARMSAEEEHLLEERRAAANATQLDTVLAIGALAFCLLGLLAFSFVNMQRDANELEAAALELADSEERYRLLVNNVSDLVLLHDSDGKLVYVSPSLETLLGYSLERASALELRSLVHPDEVEFVESQLSRFRTGTATSAVVTCRLCRKDGEYRWFEFKVAAVNDETGSVRHFQSAGRDVTARRELEQRLAEQAEELRQLSFRDGLTGLYNRRGFLELSQQVVRVAERQKHRLAALFIDLDGLKGINDGLGHERGDRAIGEAADLLRSTCRATDLVARLGGDEFVVLASDVDDAAIAALTARLEHALVEANRKANRDYQLSFSFGVASFDPLAPVPMEKLLVEADARMYEAKMRRRRARASSAAFASNALGRAARAPRPLS